MRFNLHALALWIGIAIAIYFPAAIWLIGALSLIGALIFGGLDIRGRVHERKLARARAAQEEEQQANILRYARPVTEEGDWIDDVDDEETPAHGPDCDCARCGGTAA